MKCRSCGIENSPSAQYCNCGFGFQGSKPKEVAPAEALGTCCLKCKAFNPASYQFCGECGAAMQKKTSPALIGCLGLIVLVVLIVVLFSGKSDKGRSSPSPRQSLPEVRNDPKVCLELGHYLSEDGGSGEYSIAISGTLKNNCGKNFSYVQVTFKLTDESGYLVGTALANINNLDAGETWKFKAHGFTPAKRYRLDKITAY